MKKEGLFTAKQVEHLEPGDTRREIPVGPPGLYVVMHPSGRKSWILRYRFQGRPRGLTLAKPYPDLGLAQARAEAAAALASLKNGVDPATEQATEEAKPNSVQEVAQEFIMRRIAGTRSHREVERIIEKEIVKPWKHRMIGEIKRADALRLIDAINDRGVPVMANRTLGVLKRFFSWCVERGLVEASPVDGIRPSREQSRERVLTEDELRDVWQAAGAMGYPFGPFLRLLIFTAQRRGEVATMRWQDVDLESAMWMLPREVVKAGRAHDVPLSTAAVELLQRIPHFRQGNYVFTTTSGLKAINGFQKAKNKLDKKILEHRQEPLPDWTVHDLRRTVATNLAQRNVPPHVLSSLLNHSPGKLQGITSVYNRYRYTEERREALEKWGAFVLALAEPKRKLA